MCRLDQIDEFTFEIGLVKRNRNSELPGELLAARLNFLQGRGAIDVRFANTEEIQVRSIQDHNSGGHRGFLFSIEGTLPGERLSAQRGDKLKSSSSLTRRKTPSRCRPAGGCR